MTESTPPVAHPPSEPRPRHTDGSGSEALAARRRETSVRAALIAAATAGLVMAAVQLYLWRRPDGRASDPSASASSTASLAAANLGALGTGGAAGASGAGGLADAAAPSLPLVVLSEPRVLECHDPGPRRTMPALCDRLPAVEQALAKAIEQTAACLPKEERGGAIVYAVDVSFLRKRTPFMMSTPRDGRSVRSARAVAACAQAVKQAVSGTALDGVPHGHARYKVAVTATYAAGEGMAR